MKFHKMDSFDWADFASRYTAISAKHSSPEAELTNERARLSLSPVLGVFGSSPDKQFCRRDNVDQCLAFLNQELVVLGFPSLFTASHPSTRSSDTLSITSLINCTYELLQRQQKHVKIRTDLEERNLRSDCDNEHLIQQQARLKEQLESAEREIAMANERERQLHLKIKKLKDDVKAEKEELKRTKGNSVHLQKQYDHEARKREREMMKLKDRMHQLLADKTPDRKSGIDILSLLQRADGKRAMWKTGGKDMEDMYRLLITNYEQKQKELMEENSDLRESLKAMQAELVELLNQQSGSYGTDQEEAEQSEDGSVEGLSSGHFYMPYDLVREGIESSLKEKWRILKAKLDSASKAATAGMNQEAQQIPEEGSEVHQLRQQLENYRHIVEQQEELLKAWQCKNNGDGYADSSLLSESWLCQEREQLEKEKQLLREQQETFKGERKHFTEAVINFGEQRKQFEEETLSFIKQQLVTPPKRSALGSARKPRTPTGPKLQHSTAVFSPAPRHARSSESLPSPAPSRAGRIPDTPSTENLYRVLGLKTGTTSAAATGQTCETPHNSHQTSLSPASQPSSADSSGSKENRYELNQQSKQAKRISEHAINVKRALRQRLERSSSCD